MPRTLACPACRALVEVPDDRLDRPGDCPYCRAPLPAGEFNPYAAPEAAAAPEATDEAWRPIPPSALGKVVDALRLLASNLPLFGAIVLTVWLPGSIADVAIQRSLPPERGVAATFQVTNVIEGLFGPVYTGALIYALRELKRGRRAGYAEAMGVGLRNCGRLFGARLLAGLIILLGFIALIIPGIILQIRYSLLDEVVVLEEKGASEARGRSTELTRGRRWSIFFAGIAYYAVFLPASVALGFLIGAMGVADNYGVEIVTNCLTHLLFTGFPILMFLYYWEAVRQEAKPELHPEPLGEAL